MNMRINYSHQKLFLLGWLCRGLVEITEEGLILQFWLQYCFSSLLYLKSICKVCILFHNMAVLVLMENNVLNYLSVNQLTFPLKMVSRIDTPRRRPMFYEPYGIVPMYSQRERFHYIVNGWRTISLTKLNSSTVLLRLPYYVNDFYPLLQGGQNCTLKRLLS